jgi:hypothetical protein
MLSLIDLQKEDTRTPKYRLSEYQQYFGDAFMRRVIAVRDFSDVKAGDVGGWVEGEHNLSHDGDCWIYDDARVSEQACVRQDAVVMHDAQMFGRAVAFQNAVVCNEAMACDDVRLGTNAILWRDEIAHGDVIITGVLSQAAEVAPVKTRYLH